MHGLTIGKLEFSDYDADWPAVFEFEANRLKVALGTTISEIHHIGSTAVPGLLAKPIIDIAIVFNSRDSLDAVVSILIDLGYEYRGPHDDPGHWYAVFNSNSMRLFHAHIWLKGSDGLQNQLKFRDNLRKHPSLVREYGRKKQLWAEQSNWDKLKYSQSKDDFVKKVLKL